MSTLARLLFLMLFYEALTFPAKARDLQVSPGMMLETVAAICQDTGKEINFAGGTGTAEDPWLVETPEHLNNLRYFLDIEHRFKHFKQIADIDLDIAPYNEGEGWEPIGISYENYFYSDYDGDGHIISGLYINRPDADFQALFGATNFSTISNLGLVDVNITGKRYIGALVGYFRWGIMENCHSSGNVKGNENVGLLVGDNRSRIVSCYASGSVSGQAGVGGLTSFIGATNSGLSNSFYNIDEVLINGGRHITFGGIYNDQYLEWMANGKSLDIATYDATIVPVDGHYEIGCIQGLRDLLGFSWNKEHQFVLANDIDLEEAPGLYIPYLAGTFDGNSYIVSKLHIDMDFVNFTGFIGLNNGGTIKNIGIINANVAGNDRVGALLGMNHYGTVMRVFSTGRVKGRNYVGGLAGYLQNGESEDMVSDSYTTADVEGMTYTGGFTGYFERGSTANSYSAGAVEGQRYVGGFDSFTPKAQYVNCFWNTETSGMETSSGGEGKSISQMVTADTFADWDFDDVWAIAEGETYPYLRWQGGPLPHNYPPAIYVITAIANDTLLGSIAGSGSFFHGRSVGLTAIPAAGCHFIEWTESGEVVMVDGELAPEAYNFTAEADRHLIAHFARTDDTQSIEAAFCTLEAYPNPVSGTLQLKINNNIGETITFSLVNLHGQHIFTRSISEPGPVELQINTSGIPTGIYMLRVTHCNESLLKKILVY